MTWWHGVKESASRLAADHGLEVATLAALAYPGIARYLRLPLFLLQIAAAVGVALIVIISVFVIFDFRDRRLRVSHGIEHATIALLVRLGVPIHSGTSHHDRFVVRIARESVLQLWRERVRDAAQRAIEQIAAGDKELAYAPDCGTSWSMHRVVLCISIFAFGWFALAIGAPPHVGVLALAAAVWCARALGHIVGIAAQRWLTVGTDWASVRIVDVEVGEGGEDTFEFRVLLDIVPRAT